MHTIYTCGIAGAGKRSLMRQLFNNSHKMLIEDDKTGTRFEICYSIVDDIETTFSDSDIFGIILVYDITNMESFQSIEKLISKHFDVISQARLICLVGTHRDEVDVRRVPVNSVQNIKKRFNCLFFEVSNTESINVESFKKQFKIRCLFSNVDSIMKEKEDTLPPKVSEKRELPGTPLDKQRQLPPVSPDTHKYIMYKTNLAVYGNGNVGQKKLIKNLLESKQYIPAHDQLSNVQSKITLSYISKFSNYDAKEHFGIVLVFDITSQESYDHILLVLDKFQHIQINVLAVVGTNTEKEGFRINSVKEIRKQLDQHNISLYMEVGNSNQQNIDQLKKQLQVKVIQSLLKLVQKRQDQQYVDNNRQKSPQQQNQSMVFEGQKKQKSFLSMLQGGEYYQMQCFVIGASKTGKKSLVQALLNSQQHINVKDPNSDLQFKLKLVVKEKISEIPQHTFGLIICYDITDRQSFATAQEYCTQLKTAPQFCPVRALVGCFRDKGELRAVQIQEGQQCKKVLGGMFFEISSTENINIESFKHQFLIRCIYQIKIKYQEGGLEKYLHTSQIKQNKVTVDEERPVSQEVAVLAAGIDQNKSTGNEDDKLPEHNDVVPQERERPVSKLEKLNNQLLSDEYEDDVQGNQPETTQEAAQKPAQEQLQQDPPNDHQTTGDSLDFTQNSHENTELQYGAQQAMSESIAASRSKYVAHYTIAEKPTDCQSQYNFSVPYEVEGLKMFAQKSRLAQMYLPQAMKVQRQEDEAASIMAAAMDTNHALIGSRIQQLQPTRPLLVAQRQVQKQEAKRSRINLTKNLPQNRKQKTQGSSEVIVVLEFEVGDQILSVPLHRDDNAYQVAKQFVRDYNLDPSLINKITGLIMDRIEQFIEQEKRDLLEERRMMHQTRQFHVPSSIKRINTDRQHNKPLFKFDLQIGNKHQTIAFRKGDTPQELAENFIRLMQVDRAQYYNFVVAKIQESAALYQMQVEGRGAEVL